MMDERNTTGKGFEAVYSLSKSTKNLFSLNTHRSFCRKRTKNALIVSPERFFLEPIELKIMIWFDQDLQFIYQLPVHMRW